MKWQIRFSGLASEQLVGIFRYLLDTEEADDARRLVQEIRSEGCARLKTLPFQGRVVPELLEVTRQYREIRVKSYRLIYRARPEQHMVNILLVAHVRQDIQELLLSHIIE